MNVFDKICAVIAFAVAIVFLVLGVLGIFMGCRFWFTLPPILGALPAFVGWGIVRSVWFAWKTPFRAPLTHEPPTYPDEPL